MYIDSIHCMSEGNTVYFDSCSYLEKSQFNMQNIPTAYKNTMHCKELKQSSNGAAMEQLTGDNMRKETPDNGGKWRRAC